MDRSGRVASPGRIVHYCVADWDGTTLKSNGVTRGVVLPAIVIRVWSADLLQLRVFCDGPVDAWKTSVERSNQPAEGKWCWPELTSA